LPPNAAGQGCAQGRARVNDRIPIGFAVTRCGGEIHVDLDNAVPYRLAFALAVQLREADSRNHPGSRRSNPAAGGSVEMIIAEVLRRLAVTDEAGREVVREACGDAAAGRRPRW
jgi:hypothetical protein